MISEEEVTSLMIAMKKRYGLDFTNYSRVNEYSRSPNYCCINATYNYTDTRDIHICNKRTHIPIYWRYVAFKSL